MRCAVQHALQAVLGAEQCQAKKLAQALRVSEARPIFPSPPGGCPVGWGVSEELSECWACSSIPSCFLSRCMASISARLIRIWSDVMKRDISSFGIKRHELLLVREEFFFESGLSAVGLSSGSVGYWFWQHVV